MTNISERKQDHLDLCAEDQVEFKSKTTLLKDVELFHDALPEVDLANIKLNTQLAGHPLKQPLLITGMTGGAEKAQSINKELARAAQELGIAFGVGSQRAMFLHPELTETYAVRDVAPEVVLLGNIGAVQAAEMSTAQVEELAGAIDANILCVHLNPGQELLQPEGDRNFKGCLDALTRLNEELSIPIIAKETGCGMSFGTLDKIKKTGVQWVDTSGAGGTTWIGVETLRTPPEARTLGELLWEWGVPTAASIGYAARRDFNIIASGGLRNGYDVVRAIAMGASITGMALPWLKAVYAGGADEALRYGQHLTHTIKTIMALTGSDSLNDLQKAPKMIGPTLQRWLDADTYGASS